MRTYIVKSKESGKYHIHTGVRLFKQTEDKIMIDVSPNEFHVYTKDKFELIEGIK